MKLKKFGVFTLLLTAICFSSLSAKNLNPQTTKNEALLNQLTVATQFQYNNGPITDVLATNRLRSGDIITYYLSYHNHESNIITKSSLSRIVASNMTIIPMSISCDRSVKKIVCSSHIEGGNKVVWNLLGNILPNKGGSLRYSTMVK